MYMKLRQKLVNRRAALALLTIVLAVNLCVKWHTDVNHLLEDIRVPLSFARLQLFNFRDERTLYFEAVALRQSNPKQACQLLRKAWQMVNESKASFLSITTIEEWIIMDWFAVLSYETGEIDQAIEVSKQISQNFRLTATRLEHNERNRRVFEQAKVSNYIKENAGKMEFSPVEDQVTWGKLLAGTAQYDNCKESTKRLAKDPKLFCRYDNRDRNPLLIYSPLKEEILNLDPIAILIYDVLSQRDIDDLVRMAKAKLHEAGVVNYTTGGSDYHPEQRRARHAWIRNTDLPRLNQRIEAVTGLNSRDPDACEIFQVARPHYGIGGHYGPHYDYFKTAQPDLGDRIATLLLYLNNVEEGGGTVFDKLAFRIDPVKGAGLFWYNLHRNESVDARTFHGACPVIRGEKWVTNKWFRARGQFHHRPCGKYETSKFKLADMNPPSWMKFQKIEF